MTVELKMMTLYGMLKSGVGRLKSRDGVRRTPPLTIDMMAGLHNNIKWMGRRGVCGEGTQRRIRGLHLAGILYIEGCFYRIPMLNSTLNWQELTIGLPITFLSDDLLQDDNGLLKGG